MLQLSNFNNLIQTPLMASFSLQNFLVMVL